MGKNLNSDGGLTVSQREHADALGMDHEKFRQMIIDRLLEEKGGPMKTTRELAPKIDVIECDNPVLIVGHGPSLQKNYENIRNFPGKTIVVDVAFNECVKNGIIPDYVISLEESSRIIRPKLFNPEYLKKCSEKTLFVGSAITRGEIIKHFDKNGVKTKRWSFEEEPRCSNVGAFALNYAYLELQSDKIFLVGMEHIGSKYQPYVYSIWQIDFWYFVKKMPKQIVVNCCNGGALYYEDYIIDTTLDRVKIENKE